MLAGQDQPVLGLRQTVPPLWTMRQIFLYPDHEDGGWTVEVPSLPGCISCGATREEAITNARDAIETWIDGAQRTGVEAPKDTLEAELRVI
ncbi:hypothetical protein Pla175_08490 [Pirellulimonas nuda]|uniref:HicB-like antitoxin of toxin-antitoxin system domain-containing protein n=2 Tax=Pirellulimonas nuda TaxID=2528009 RepID=A0A518D7N1_9BACT|nr:hypothetical protein Pla175_08490 [Pirellulimonas nuda]